ncbi:MAG: MTH938/NDUFAF3 family protein [Pseudomonadota bacterium]
MSRNNKTRTQRYGWIIWIVSGVICWIGCSEVNVDYTPPEGSRDTAITHFSYSDIVVDGHPYDHDIVISADGTVRPWQLDPGNIVTQKNVCGLIDPSIRTIIIGLGTSSHSEFSQQSRDAIRNNGVNLFVSNTYDAVRLYNKTPKNDLAAFIHVGH